jgi:hypothetical protein
MKFILLAPSLTHTFINTLFIKLEVLSIFLPIEFWASSSVFKSFKGFSSKIFYKVNKKIIHLILT